MEHLLKTLLAVQPPWKSLFFEEQDFMEPDSCLGGGMRGGCFKVTVCSIMAGHLILCV